MTASKTKKMVLSAMLIALGTAISFVSEWIPFLNLPFGGTVTLASMLPLILVSYLYGIRWGLGAGFVYALLQVAVGFRTVSALFLPDSGSYTGIGIALLIIALDYLLAFTLVGLGGMFRNKWNAPLALSAGTVVALLLRYLSHLLSGALFYGAWAEWFFTESAAKNLAFSEWIMTHLSGAGLSVAYSAIYNGLYMLPEIIITVLAALAVSKLPMIRKAQ